MSRRRGVAAVLGRFLHPVVTRALGQAVQEATRPLRSFFIAAQLLRREIRQLELQLERVATTPPKRREAQPCTVPGCDRPHVAHGYCKGHYQAWRYRRRKIAEATARGLKYLPPRPGEKRPGRPPRVPLPA